MNKKAQTMIMGIVAISIAAIFIANLYIPQIQQSTESQPFSQDIAYTRSNTTNTSLILTQTTNLEDASLSIAGLTVNVNYTINYDTGNLSFIANTTNTDTYTASYSYYTDRYIDSTSDRLLMATVITIGIVGLVFVAARTFGLA